LLFCHWNSKNSLCTWRSLSLYGDSLGFVKGLDLIVDFKYRSRIVVWNPVFFNFRREELIPLAFNSSAILDAYEFDLFEAEVENHKEVDDQAYDNNTVHRPPIHIAGFWVVDPACE